MDMELSDALFLHRVLSRSSRDLARLWQNAPAIIATRRCRDLIALGISEPDAVTLLSRDGADEVESDLRWLESNHCDVLTIDDLRYPPLLREIEDPPPLLFMRGDPACLDPPRIAIVGSRRSTAQGRKIAEGFARELCMAGLTVVSGMASGIDGEAHRGALAAGGPTIAVLGTGIDLVYPKSHGRLALAIADKGLLLSEYPIGTPGLPRHFPRRNRIISGLSLGVLVVQAAARSGSLVTARMAMEQSREVFAVPGSILTSVSRGCHRLIKDGAKLTECVDDVLEELGPLAALERRTTDRGDAESEAHRVIVTALGDEPVTVDELSERTGMDVSDLSAALLLLELGNVVVADASGYVLHPSVG